VLINKDVMKTGGGRAWITIIPPLHSLTNKCLPLCSLTNKWSRGEEGWGAMENDYLTPVPINKQVVKREEGGGRGAMVNNQKNSPADSTRKLYSRIVEMEGMYR
jgi:hypothetical protein